MIFSNLTRVFFFCTLFAIACNSNQKENIVDTPLKGTFAYDVDFLSKNDSIIILKNQDSSGQIIVSPKYQAKVFTSTANGPEGRSFGWINYEAFSQPVNDHMNAYGGEDRLWLGPEGGKFSLYFKANTEMVFDNWHTPAGIDSEPWDLISAGSNKASMQKNLDLVNYAGTKFSMRLERDVEILENEKIKELLSIETASGISTVGFTTTNSIINTGTNEWTETTGAPCLWNLDMFTPSASCTIVIPYVENTEGKVATTDYFGEISKDRIMYKEGVLFFKADGKSRGKLGIPPNRAREIAGSYDAENKVLTVTLFDVDNQKKYLNQEWNTDKDPYSGDAVNAYNDGPLEDGSQMGPFFEIESVSPAAFLKQNEKLTHHHTVFHFTGDESGLDQIAKKVFGVTLEDIKKAF